MDSEAKLINTITTRKEENPAAEIAQCADHIRIGLVENQCTDQEILKTLRWYFMQTNDIKHHIARLMDGVPMSEVGKRVLKLATDETTGWGA
ncbi:MAG: hypothetical protein IT544_01640 [Rhodobacteraceae bacterium]|nr:hypothetical protein [Paracoccaceae bacterium]